MIKFRDATEARLEVFDWMDLTSTHEFTHENCIIITLLKITYLPKVFYELVDLSLASAW